VFSNKCVLWQVVYECWLLVSADACMERSVDAAATVTNLLLILGFIYVYVYVLCICIYVCVYTLLMTRVCLTRVANVLLMRC
jgi:hypothetical protein